MRFVKFTRNDGVPILINLDKVDGCTPEKPGSVSAGLLKTALS